MADRPHSETPLPDGQRAWTHEVGNELMVVGEDAGYFLVSNPRLSGCVSAVGDGEANLTTDPAEAVKVVIANGDAQYVEESKPSTEKNKLKTYKGWLHLQKVRANATGSWEFSQFIDPDDELLKSMGGQVKGFLRNRMDKGIAGVQRGVDGKQVNYASPLDSNLRESASGVVYADFSASARAAMPDVDRFAVSAAIEQFSNLDVMASEVVWTNDIDRHRRDARGGNTGPTNPLYGQTDPDYQLDFHTSNNLGRFDGDVDEAIVGYVIARQNTRHRIWDGVRVEVNPYGDAQWDADEQDVRVIGLHGFVVPPNVPAVIAIRNKAGADPRES